MTRSELLAQIEALRSALRFITDPWPGATERDLRNVARRILELWPEPGDAADASGIAPSSGRVIIRSTAVQPRVKL